MRLEAPKIDEAAKELILSEYADFDVKDLVADESKESDIVNT